MSRAERAVENRERVLSVAREVFGRKGYHGASLDEIADTAGFSKGVVYSQFGSKDDLFLAVLERRIEERAGQNMDAARRAPARTGFRAVWALGQRVRHDDADWMLALLEFRIHAARDASLNQRYAQLHDRTVKGIAEVVKYLAGREESGLPIEAEELARASLVFANGYTLELLVAPQGWAAAWPDTMARLLRPFGAEGSKQ